MSQKKCPKCGEMNPGEAVMCWACYTPLTGGAVAGGGTAAMAATPAATATDADKKEKKPIEPWQLGVVGVAVVLALGFGVSQMMGSSSSETTDPGTAEAIPKPIRNGGRGKAPSDVNTGTITLPASGGGGAMPITQVAQYAVVSPPNPEMQWGVVGLAVNDTNVTAERAAGMATFAYQQFAGKSKWKAMQIFVFRDRDSATQFNRFQIGRKYDVVSDDDNVGLASLWPNCLVRFEANGGGAPEIRYPSQNPTGWWRGSGAR